VVPGCLPFFRFSECRKFVTLTLVVHGVKQKATLHLAPCPQEFPLLYILANTCYLLSFS
jgi:hypothetical protein